MKSILLVLLIGISISIVTAILFQPRSGGAGAIFGGGTEVYRTRRGFEKILHYLTILLVILFSAIAFGLIFVQ
ncbi:MAG: preprotein translocase subunit SecG [Candidatus Woykebacteria bacterium RBG_13_40_15]|uniref:Protein-export membrane protein SecG n=1 Tax=Candidatus Woykebacteria bacterium RBG_13_40_15 TaxID=1802593 RepID=A0A1G1W799_9BACT|nr:MAG: preprotein translocase subunit SecG [Candidatus Woykebacteria bacterium RBG_13_40_15]